MTVWVSGWGQFLEGGALSQTSQLEELGVDTLALSCPVLVPPEHGDRQGRAVAGGVTEGAPGLAVVSLSLPGQIRHVT